MKENKSHFILYSHLLIQNIFYSSEHLTISQMRILQIFFTSLIPALNSVVLSFGNRLFRPSKIFSILLATRTQMTNGKPNFSLYFLFNICNCFLCSSVSLSRPANACSLADSVLNLSSSANFPAKSGCEYNICSFTDALLCSKNSSKPFTSSSTEANGRPDDTSCAACGQSSTTFLNFSSNSVFDNLFNSSIDSGFDMLSNRVQVMNVMNRTSNKIVESTKKTAFFCCMVAGCCLQLFILSCCFN